MGHKFYSKLISCLGTDWENKNLSLFTNIFCRFSGNFIEKTTFEKFVDICEQIRKE